MGQSRQRNAPTPAIVVEHSRAPNLGRQTFGEIVDADRCKLTVALRRGRTRVLRNGSLLHEGPVFPGMVRLSGPGDRIEGELFTAMEAVSVGFPASRIADRRVANLRPILGPNARIEQLGRLLLNVADIDGRYSGLFGDGILDALLALMLDHSDRVPAARRPKPGFDGDELRRVLDFAEDRIGRPLGLAEWSAAFGLPAPEFTRRFRSSTGSAPYSYFLRRRIERAQDRLTGTDAGLAEIALDLGFCSQSHFTEAFRRVAGVSPGQWRRNRG